MTEPSAAGGGYSEAEEAQNKESHKRQRRESTIFWVGSRRFPTASTSLAQNRFNILSSFCWVIRNRPFELVQCAERERGGHISGTANGSRRFTYDKHPTIDTTRKVCHNNTNKTNEVNIMDKELEYGVQDGDMTVTLTLDDDNELECLIVAIFPVLEKDYIALYPQDEAYGDEVFLYRLDASTEEPQLVNIEDDAEFALVGAAYDALMAEDEEE